MHTTMLLLSQTATTHVIKIERILKTAISYISHPFSQMSITRAKTYSDRNLIQ